MSVGTLTHICTQDWKNRYYLIPAYSLNKLNFVSALTLLPGSATYETLIINATTNLHEK